MGSGLVNLLANWSLLESVMFTSPDPYRHDLFSI